MARKSRKRNRKRRTSSKQQETASAILDQPVKPQSEPPATELVKNAAPVSDDVVEIEIETEALADIETRLDELESATEECQTCDEVTITVDDNSSDSEVDVTNVDVAEVDVAELNDPGETVLVTETPEVMPADESPNGSALVAIVSANTEMLQFVSSQIAELRDAMVAGNAPAPSTGVLADTTELENEIEQLRNRLADAEARNDELAISLSELESQPEHDKSRGGTPLSWDERKELIIQQMEDDTFDADSFVAELQTEDTDDLTPVDFVNGIIEELRLRENDLAQRDAEICELKTQLSNQVAAVPPTSSDAAISDLIESDDVIRDERAKLQEMQSEWEERFREGEIAASLERAKLSRERRELARRNAELEEQLVHFRRESEENRKAGVNGSRRWLAKLGLTDISE